MPATKQKAQLLEQLTKLATAVIMEDELDRPIVRLSPTEQKVVNAIGTEGKVAGKTIAKAIGREGAGNSLWDLLAALVRHGILTNEKGSDGYSVHPFWAHLVQEEEEAT